MTGKQLIIFDLISTLTNAGPRYARAFGEVCQQFGVTPPEDEDVLGMLGNKNLKEITNHFAGSLADDTKQEFMAVCNTACDAMLFNLNWIERLYDGAYDLLASLHADGYQLGIFTGTRKDSAESQFHYHNINKFFNPDYIRAKDNERDGMIHNAQLKTLQLSSIVEKFKLDGGDEAAVLVVGDSESDFYAAKELGLDFIGFTMSEHHKEKLAAAGAEIIIDNYQDFPDLKAVAPYRPPLKNAVSQLKNL